MEESIDLWSMREVRAPQRPGVWTLGRARERHGMGRPGTESVPSL